MMAIIIHDPKAVVLEQFFLTPRRPLEGANAGGNFCKLKADLVKERNHRASVGDIFFAKQWDTEFTPEGARMPDLEASRTGPSGVGCSFLFHPVIGQWMKTVGESPRMPRK